jgi:hypothetical protein
VGTLDCSGSSRASAPGFARSLLRPIRGGLLPSDAKGASFPGPADTDAPPLSVWFVDQAVCPEYDAYAAGHPDGTPFHMLDWRAALIDCRAGEPFYLMAMKGGRVVGVLPLLERSTGRGLVLESLPHTPVAGLLADDGSAARVLLERAARLAQRRGAAAVVLKSFVPASEAVADDGQRAWTRLARTALRTSGSAAGSAGPRLLESTALAALSGTQIAALSKIDPTIGVLAAWRGLTRAAPVCLLERAAQSIARPRAVSLAYGEVVRVFDAAGMDHTGAVRLSVLRQVAGMAPATCRWIECLLAAHERSTLVAGDADGAARVAAQQAFLPRELLSLVATRSE